jgi:hypothetical protein
MNIQVQEHCARLFGSSEDRSRAISASMSASYWQDGSLIVGLHAALTALFGDHSLAWLTTSDPSNFALRRLQANVERKQAAWFIDQSSNRRWTTSSHDRDTFMHAAVCFTVDVLARLLAPAIDAPSYADVAILLGPDLVELRQERRNGSLELTAYWNDWSMTRHALEHVNTTERVVSSLRHPEHNSHVDRIVHPHGWSHADRIRAQWAEYTLVGGSVLHRHAWLYDDSVDVYMHGHVIRCDRCHTNRSFQQWLVWAPYGYEPRQCDIGPCPACDKWTPTVDVLETLDGETWDIDALRFGETVAWHDLSDRQLLEVIRYLDHNVWRMGDLRQDLGFALTEAAYRNLVPDAGTLLHVIDYALGRGHIVEGDIARLSLIDVWTRFVPMLTSTTVTQA